MRDLLIAICIVLTVVSLSESLWLLALGFVVCAVEAARC